MRIGISSSCAIGLAIALTLGGVSTARAQQTDSTRQAKTGKKAKTKRTTGSQQRIPITKESGGEVTPAPPPVNQDSIAAAERARQDSIAAAAERARQEELARQEQMRREAEAAAERRRQDSVAAAERARADSAARADSIARAEYDRISHIRKAGGWYFGIGFGASIPTGAITGARDQNGGYSTGWNMTVPIGYDFHKSPLGLRFDATFDEMHGKDFLSNVSAPNLKAWSGSLDLRLRAPLGRTWSRFYLLGGPTYSNLHGWFNDFTNPNDPNRASFGSSNGRWGWNAGGGFNFAWGNMVGLFVESRYVTINANTVTGFPYQRSDWVPIVLGVTF
jgi:hypothetical protein